MTASPRRHSRLAGRLPRRPDGLDSQDRRGNRDSLARLGRLGRAVGGALAGGLTGPATAAAVTGVLALGALADGPVATGDDGSTEPGLTLTAAHRHRWPGHPGRELVRYRVHRGDTATGLAVRFHAWTAELRALNHLGRHGRVYVGQRLRIPVVTAAAHRAHRARHTRTHHGRHAKAHHTRQHHSRHHHHYHRPWRHADASRAVVRRTIVRTARRHHVAPSLALAVAWQESGWQQRRVSRTHAIGAMQVMPGTGRWISLYVGRRLNIYGLHDNITAGVVLLRVLRHEASLKGTIASYYQGLGSVRSHGMYHSTHAYTRNVVALRKRLRHGWNPA